MKDPTDALIDFYAAIQRAHIDAELAAMTHRRIADDLGRALSYLFNDKPFAPSPEVHSAGAAGSAPDGSNAAESARQAGLIASDRGQTLSILAGSLPGRPDAASPPPSTNASGLPLPAPVLAEPDTPKANNFGQFRDEARDRAQDRGPGKGLAAGNSSDGPWLGGGNGSRDVFDHVHRYPRGRWS